MESYRNTAFYLALWYAVLAALVAVLLIALNDVPPATGLLIAANAALLFALGLMVASGRLNRQFWRTLPPRKRPMTEASRQMARRALEETWLRFAKGAAIAAIALCACAYVTNGVSASALAKAMRTPAMAKSEPGDKTAWSSYRSARLVPTN